MPGVKLPIFRDITLLKPALPLLHFNPSLQPSTDISEVLKKARVSERCYKTEIYSRRDDQDVLQVENKYDIKRETIIST